MIVIKNEKVFGTNEAITREGVFDLIRKEEKINNEEVSRFTCVFLYANLHSNAAFVS